MHVCTRLHAPETTTVGACLSDIASLVQESTRLCDARTHELHARAEPHTPWMYKHSCQYHYCRKFIQGHTKPAPRVNQTTRMCTDMLACTTHVCACMDARTYPPPPLPHRGDCALIFQGSTTVKRVMFVQGSRACAHIPASTTVPESSSEAASLLQGSTRSSSSASCKLCEPATLPDFTPCNPWRP